MAESVNKLSMIIFLIILIILFTTALILFVFYMMRKKQKSEESHAEKESAQSIPVLDTKDLLPIDDIDDDMIIEKGRTRFHACISCIGSDFYNSSYDEKVRTQNNYIDFLFALNEPITKRVHSESISMDYTIERYYRARNRLEEELFHLTEDYKDLTGHTDFSKIDSDDLKNQLATMRRQMSALNWRIRHIDDELRYMNLVSGDSVKSKKQLYVFSWENGISPINAILTEEELYRKAKIELDKICRVKIRQLADAGVSATRCSTQELIDICRKQTLPFSGNLFSVEQMSNSFLSGIVTTDSVDKLNREFDEDVLSELLRKGK